MFSFISTAHADIAITRNTNGSTGGGQAGEGGYTDGWSFTLSDPVLITDLGMWDDLGGNGLQRDHPIAIWASDGTLQLQAILAHGTGGQLINGFRYNSITPTLLLPGSYVIGVYYLGNTPSIYDGIDNTFSSFTSASPVTYGGKRRTTSSGSDLTFPTSVPVGGPEGIWGPNFQFTAAVPEPATTALLIISGAFFILARKRCARR